MKSQNNTVNPESVTPAMIKAMDKSSRPVFLKAVRTKIANMSTVELAVLLVSLHHVELSRVTVKPSYLNSRPPGCNVAYCI